MEPYVSISCKPSFFEEEREEAERNLRILEERMRNIEEQEIQAEATASAVIREDLPIHLL